MTPKYFQNMKVKKGHYKGSLSIKRIKVDGEIFFEKNCLAMLAIGVTIQSIDSMGRVRILNITLCFDQLDLYLPCISTYLIVFILFAN